MEGIFLHISSGEERMENAREIDGELSRNLLLLSFRLSINDEFLRDTFNDFPSK